MKSKKIAFIVQRYGLEVNGGAELHCRQLAEHLAAKYNVEILTTCAKDYMTWRNEYPSGKTNINNIPVIRFKTDCERDFTKERFYNYLISPRIKAIKNIKLRYFILSFFKKYRYSDKWLELQGPYCPDLIKYLQENHNQYDVLVFMTYLYYPTAVGLRVAPQKSILIPTAHDEDPIYFSIFNQVFHLPAFIMFNMESERTFVHQLFKNRHIPNDIAGVGIDLQLTKPISTKEKKTIQGQYILYVGRLDKNKGVNDLFDIFFEYKKKTKEDIKLVLIGKSCIDIPENQSIVYLGFVSDEVKIEVMSNALLLVLPSKYESLSMVVLESLALQTPVLVNGHCEVLVEHCKKSNAGFYYFDKTEFNNYLDFAIKNSETLQNMGVLGKKYVEENYRWDVILEKFEQAFGMLPSKI